MSTESSNRVDELRSNIEAIQRDIDKAAGDRSKRPRLVLVSKLKPPSDIKAAYDAGHRAFGENYVDELEEKAPHLPQDIEWHFIGSLQSNKCKRLASITNLWALQTLDATKKADALERTLAESDRKLRVYLQVNTSGEESKSGLAPLLSDDGSKSSELNELAQHVRSACPHLQLQGVMTIGSWDASHDHTSENPDFVRLRETRDRLAAALDLSPSDLDLSMGMSADFEAAIVAGSDTVRVGSRAFGQRGSKEDAKAAREKEINT